jgi:ribonuclease VapC
VILDSSAIVSILFGEPATASLLQRMADASILAVSAPTVLESTMVLSRSFKGDARAVVNEFLREFQIEVIPFSREHCDVAVDAFHRFGKGRHPASLNFGDCMSYAAARLSGLPLLFTGDDFLKTDIGV